MNRLSLVLVISGLFLTSAIAGGEDHPLKVTKKPRPTAKGCPGPGGNAIAKVTFKSDATIGDAVMVSPSQCEVFNDSVLEVIKDIEFEPEVKDGQAVTVTKQLEYTYAVF